MNEVLTVRNLKKHYKSVKGPLWNRQRHTVKAVDGISFSLEENQVMGIVGESGCGKTTTGMMLIGLETPTEGEVNYQGENLYGMEEGALKTLRRNMQIIFQDPFASLDPMWNLGQIITEPFVIHQLYSPSERLDRTAELLKIVGLDGDYIIRYPHELSGGQRQRVAIARALALEPSFIIADEPTSALDVSVKAQIINLLEELQEEKGLSMIFISHDLSVVHHICNRIQVMYYGKIVESGPTEAIFANPIHPYTRVLLESIPVADPARRRERKLSQEDHLDISRELLGSDFTLDPPQDGSGDSSIAGLEIDPKLEEVERDHLVRVYRRS